LEWVISVFPMLKERLDAPAGALSGGQQTQVNIGRALMGRPKMLLLDEPTLGLDPQNVKALEYAIKEIMQQRHIGVMIADQHVALAKAFPERVLVISGGEILFDGTLDGARSAGALESICV
jgi:branched-chain amino acid transport system ATP-binding protein